MNRITVNDAFITQLGGIAQPVEVCDAEGHTLGHFVPIVALSTSEDSPYSADELSRMHGEEGGRLLSEIWKSLGAK